MQLELAQPMNDVFCRVMESLAFYFVDPMDKQEIAADRDMDIPYRQVSMRFEGPHFGSVVLFLPHSMFKTILANMLGIDEEGTEAEAQQNDAICELLNVICGQLLTEIWGTGPVFDLRIPEMKNVTIQELEEVLRFPSTCCFSSDDGVILLQMHVDETT